MKPKVKVESKKATISTITLTWAANECNTDYQVAAHTKTPLPKDATVTLTKNDKKGNALNTLTFTGLQASTKYTVEVRAYIGDSLETAVHKSALGKISISTAMYTAVSKVVPTVSGSRLALNWQIPTGSKVAPGAGYTAYEIDWVVSSKERKSVAIDSVAADGKRAMVRLSTLDSLGIDLMSATKYNFVIRAVVLDGTTVMNQSQEAKFSLTPSKLV